MVIRRLKEMIYNTVSTKGTQIVDETQASKAQERKQKL